MKDTAGPAAGPGTMVLLRGSRGEPGRRRGRAAGTVGGAVADGHVAGRRAAALCHTDRGTLLPRTGWGNLPASSRRSAGNAYGRDRCAPAIGIAALPTWSCATARARDFRPQGR